MYTFFTLAFESLALQICKQSFSGRVKKCSITFAAEISALDRISAMEKKIEFVNSRIRDDALLRNEVPSLNKPDYPFLNADKIGFHRNRIESSSSSQSISGSKKRKAEEFVMEPTQRKLIDYLVTTWKHFAPMKSPHASAGLEYYNFNVLFRFLLAIFLTY